MRNYFPPNSRFLVIVLISFSLIWNSSLSSAQEAAVPTESAVVSTGEPSPVATTTSTPETPPVQTSTELSSNDLEKLDFANGLFERGFYDMAKEEYQKFIDLFPQSSYLNDAYFAKAECFFFLKSYQEAILTYQQYRELYPSGEKAAIAQLRLGQLYYLTEKFSEGLSALNAVPLDQLNPTFVQVLNFYLGKTKRALKDEEGALVNFQKATEGLAEGAYSSFAYIEMGEIYSGRKEFDQAKALYEKAQQTALSDETEGLSLYKQGEVLFLAGQYEPSAEIFKKVLTDYKEQDISQDALTNLLIVYFNSSQYEKLLETYNTCKDRIAAEPEFFNVHFAIASAQVELKAYEDALAALDKLLSTPGISDEDRNKVFLKKTEIFIKTDRFAEGLAFLEKELKDSPQGKEYILFLQAETYYGLKQFDKALELYNQVVTVFPSSTYAEEGLYGMAHSQYALGKDLEALQSFLDYIQKGKDEAKRQESLYNAVLISSKLNQKEKAREYAEQFLQSYPQATQVGEINGLLANLYSDTDRNKAIEFLKKIIAEEPDENKLQEKYFLLGYNLQLASQVDEALTYYEKVRGEKAERDTAYSSLKNSALIYLQKKDEPKAAALFERLIKEFDKNDLGADIYLWLGEQYLEQQKFQDVIDLLSKLSADQTAVNSAGVAYLQAEAYRGLKDCAKAVFLYDQAGVGGNLQAAAKISKGQCQVELGDLEGAVKTLESAAQLSPEDNTVAMRSKFELANVQYLRKNLDEAGKLYLLIGVLYDDKIYTPLSLSKAGEILELQNKKQEALKIYQELVTKYPESAPVVPAQERIKVLSAR